jgi:polysaccharide biosynthesis transport protein
VTTFDDSHAGGNGRPGGSAAPFGSGAPFEAAGARATSHSEQLFTDPRQVIKRAIQIVRSRWAAGLLAAIAVGAAIGAVLFRFRPIEYTAVSTMLAQSSLDQILNPEGETPEEFDHEENALTNHLSVMMSNMFRQRLADTFTPGERLEIQRPYLKEGQGPSREILLALLAKKIDVEREREKEFFTVSVRHVSSDTALLVANRFTATYLALVQSELHKANKAAADILGSQASALQREIAALEDERREYRGEHNLISPEENQIIIEDRIKEVNLARSDLRVQRAKLEAEVNQARRDLENSPLPFTNSVLSANPGTQLLRQQLDALEVQRDVLSLRYGPNHEKMVEVKGSIAATRDALARNFQQAFADLRSQLSLATESEKGLDAEFNAAFNESLELSRLAGHLNALGQEADGKRKTLDDLFQRIGKAAIDTGLPADVLRVIDPGYIKRPLVPMIAVYAAIIGMFTLGAFVLVPIAFNFFDERINENADLEGALGMNVIGVVPRLSRTPKEDRPHIVRDNVNLAFAEAFLTIASQVDLVSRKGLSRRILVTSTLPGEGKSTLVANLAAAYTRLGRRTVIVDCDFRKPSQRAIHKAGGEAGLLPWAKAGFNEAQGLLGTGGPLDVAALADGTFLVPAGATDLQPARYLIADGMARFFALLQAEFEIVIVDTPPAGVFQDALVVARHCDETVFVARHGMASTGQLNRILNDFAKTAAPAVGIVLNGFSPNASHPQLGHHQLYRKYGYYTPSSRRVAAGTK